MARSKKILRQIKTTFQAGELDPLMAMRSDVNAYDNARKDVSLSAQKYCGLDMAGEV